MLRNEEKKNQEPFQKECEDKDCSCYCNLSVTKSHVFVGSVAKHRGSSITSRKLV